MIFRATNQKLWMFEVSRYGLARAGMCCSQPARIDHMCKKWKVGGKKNSKKMVQSLTGQVSTCSRRATNGHHLACQALFIFFEILLFFFKKNWKFGEWTKAFGRMGVQHFHFLKLAPTLGSVKCSSSHGDWSFHFFIIFFPEFRVHLDLHIHHWDICFMKN
jgi:hypothetical protein